MPLVEINDITGIATVSVTETIAQVSVDDSAEPVIVSVNVIAPPEIIEVGILGPQGPQGIQGPVGPVGSSTLANLTDVNVAAKVDKSVLYFDQTSSKFVANDVNTIVTLTDGGNF